MSLLNAKRLLLALATLFSAAVCAQTVAPGNLDELLEQTRNARAREAQANQAREARFLAERNQRAQMLGQAETELAALRRREASLSREFDANEQRLAEIEEQLFAKSGNLGELFGVTRQVAGDFSSVLYNSLITAQFPERDAFVSELSKSKALPSISVLERFWFEMQREMTETGKTVRFKSTVVTPDGEPIDTEVARVGGFVAVAGGKYLTYLPSEHQLSVMPRQLGSPYKGLAADLTEATEGVLPMMVDPTRGVLLALAVQRPTIIERIEQGEAVGVIILGVGAIGALMAIYQFFYLMKVSVAVNRQLKQVERPVADNPLGRVLATFKGDAAKLDEDPEIVELRISEAVLREVPPLERFQSFLRLAVAAGPLLGLIGTVIGMIITFQSITESGSGDPRLMAAGISQAMIATVLGLGIAIPLLFANAALVSRSRQIVQILDEQSTGLLAERLEASRRA